MAESSMDLSEWRKKVDELDRKLAALLNERAAAVVEIGRLKRNTSLPIYEPDRERAVLDNVKRSSAGPLAERDPGADLRAHYGRHAQHTETRNSPPAPRPNAGGDP
jgi:chorismate mutase